MERLRKKGKVNIKVGIRYLELPRDQKKKFEIFVMRENSKFLPSIKRWVNLILHLLLDRHW